MNFSLRSVFASDLFKNISFYTIFRLINRSLPVLLLPFLTNYLTPKDYSILDIFTNISYIVLPLIGLNAYSSMSRYYYDKEINYKLFLSTIINFSLITCVILSILSLVFNNYIFKFINIEKINLFLFTIVLFSLLEQIVLIYTTNLRLEEKVFEYGIIGIVRTAIELLSTLVIVIYLITDWRGRIIGQSLGLVLIALFSIYKLYSEGYLSFIISTNLLKKSLYFGFPLIIHTISGILLGFSNRFFIIKYVGLNQAGVFASAYQLCFVVSLLHTSFNEAWVPYLFKSLTTNDSYNTRKNLVKITYIYFVFLTLLTIVFVSIIPYIYRFIGKNFYINYLYVIIIAFSFLFNGFYKMLVNYLFYAKKTLIIAIGTFIVLILNLIFNYYLILNYQLLGASLSLFLTFFVHFIFFLIFVNKYFKLPWFYFFKNNRYEKIS